jgi:hypothetical protein
MGWGDPALAPALRNAIDEGEIEEPLEHSTFRG